MKTLKNKIAAITIAIFFILSMTNSMILIPNASTHTPPWHWAIAAYIIVSPSTTGIGQTVLLDFFADWLPPGDTLLGGGKWTGMTITVTAPDGTNSTLGPFISDPTGGTFTQYTPASLGTYTFVLNFPGQYASNTSPVTGLNGTGGDTIGDYFEAATSKPVYLTVQQDPVPGPVTYPLPTAYWTRPINGQNVGWYQIASNWLGGPYTATTVQESGTAPNSAHIMWSLPLDTGGVVGGNAPLNTATNGTGFYSGLAYNARDCNPIIMNGLLYVMIPRQNSNSEGGIECINLRTGAIVWVNKNMPLIQFGYYYDLEYPNQFGVIPSGVLFTANFAQAFDPITGESLFNVTNVPAYVNDYAQQGPLGFNAVPGPNGATYIYQLNIKAGWIAEWNSSNLLTYKTNLPAPGGTPGAYTTTGLPIYAVTSQSQTVDASSPMFYDWNVSIPAIIKNDNYTIGNVGQYPALTGTQCMWSIFNDEMIGGNIIDSTEGWGTPDPFTLWAISLKPETAGQLLWFRNYTAPPNNETLRFDAVDPMNRVIIFHNKETFNWVAYNIDTGDYAWTTDLPPTTSGFEYFDEPVIKPAEFVYHGTFISGGYAGVVYCFNCTNGKTLWTFGNGVGDNSTSSTFIVYGACPTFPVAAADGKIYTSCGEHSPNSPLWQDGFSYCINASTGDFIFKTSDWAGYPGRIGVAIADGYLEYYNAYDGQIYCVGKGPTDLTVDAPMTSIPLDSSFVIRGTITDISAGTKQNAQAMNFPHGVPCVSDASMTAWMNYVYAQQPKPTDATGVAVSIDVIDPNGNYIHLGETHSDSSGLYSFQVDPSMLAAGPGAYTVVANFAGSNSYWPSQSESSFIVNSASATPAPTSTPTSVADMYFLPVSIVIILAIVIIGIILALLMLRKRP